jgi:hypothetical protein
MVPGCVAGMVAWVEASRSAGCSHPAERGAPPRSRWPRRRRRDFSTTMRACGPRRGAARSARSRPRRSAEPPAKNGDTRLMGRTGQTGACPCPLGCASCRGRRARDGENGTAQHAKSSTFFREPALRRTPWKVGMLLPRREGRRRPVGSGRKHRAGFPRRHPPPQVRCVSLSPHHRPPWRPGRHAD